MVGGLAMARGSPTAAMGRNGCDRWLGMGLSAPIPAVLARTFQVCSSTLRCSRYSTIKKHINQCTKNSTKNIDSAMMYGHAKFEDGQNFMRAEKKEKEDAFKN